jgi:MFS family permease
VPSPNRYIFATLFFSIFAAVTGVGIVVPLLPVYAHSLGASGLYIGLIFGAFSLSRTFFLPYFGHRSDRHGRKPYIVTGMFGYALISLALVATESVTALIAIRFLQGIASAMMMPVIQAYVGDITPPGKEGSLMGLFNMSLFLGLSFGPVIGGLLNDQFSLTAAFSGMGLLAAVGFFLCLTFLPPTSTETIIRGNKLPVSWLKLLKDCELMGLFAFRLAYTTCIGIIWGFLPILADTEFGLSSFVIGLLVMLGVFISGLIHVPAGFIADRVNKLALIVIGGVLVMAAMHIFDRARGINALMAANVLFGLGGGVAMPALMAMAVIKGHQTGAMGAVMALLTMAHSLGMLIGALSAGLIMDFFNLRYAFVSGTILMALGTVFCYAMMAKAAARHGE